VFALVNPESLQKCFLRWIQQIVKKTKGEVIALDGKQSRGSYDRNRNQSALHVVSAWANENRLMLGQVKVKDKSNEISAIPSLLKLSKTKFEYSCQSKTEAGHHRLEKRICFCLPTTQIELYKQEQWNGLQTIVMVNRKRYLWNKVQTETQFYLSSLPCDAQLISRAIRQHWSIENQLHWVLDVTFNEDSSRIRRGHSPENFTLLRRMAISLLNQETKSKRSLRQKTKLAAMSCNYMFDVLLSALK
jgi:predicted transposase YbfD/YdcC